MKAYCIKCKQKTNHEVIKEYKYEYDQNNTPEMEIEFAKGTWQIIKCKGCEEISFRECWVTSEDFDYNNGIYQPTEYLYPPRGEGVLVEKNFFCIPRKLRDIYREIIECFNNKAYILCAAGLRALIEGICAEEGVEDGPVCEEGKDKIKRSKNLKAKIEGLSEKGLLTKQHADILHEHRFLGNNAVHELDKPSSKELKIAIEIVEHTLENMYELVDKIEELKFLKKNRKK